MSLTKKIAFSFMFSALSLPNPKISSCHELEELQHQSSMTTLPLMPQKDDEYVGIDFDFIPSKNDNPSVKYIYIYIYIYTIM